MRRFSASTPDSPCRDSCSMTRRCPSPLVGRSLAWPFDFSVNLPTDILPSPEKKLDLPRNYLHWHFLDVEAQPEIWLAYYASDEERDAWAEETGLSLPQRRKPPYPRRMPRRPA